MGVRERVGAGAGEVVGLLVIEVVVVVAGAVVLVAGVVTRNPPRVVARGVVGVVVEEVLGSCW